MYLTAVPGPSRLFCFTLSCAKVMQCTMMMVMLKLLILVCAEILQDKTRQTFIVIMAAKKLDW